MKKEEIIITDAMNYNSKTVKNYSALVKRLSNDSIKVNIQGINLAIACLPITDLDREILISKYGLQDGIYKSQTTHVEKSIYKKVDYHTIQDSISSSMKHLASLKSSLYYDEQKREMLDRFADLQGNYSPQNFAYLKLYCKLFYINLKDFIKDFRKNSLLLVDFKKSIENCLDSNYLLIIKKRFGLVDDYPKSVKEVSDELSICVDEVERIESSAIRKIRKLCSKDSFFLEKKIEFLKTQITNLEALRNPTKYEEYNLLNSTSIANLSLTPKTYNCLRRAGITTVDELLMLTENDFNSIRNLGLKTRKEIISIQRIFVLS